ncbi:MAG: hypothetical protein DSY55_04865 [Clostridia bacterium]|nr:MAG: hypothetical protein DSY55_04865 [Clostridia bacterium]
MLGRPLSFFGQVPNVDKTIWASEQRNVLTNDLDIRSTLELAGLMHLEDERAVAAVKPNLPAPMADMADYVLAPRAGPEVITGSTRLKAGTAQKLVLNMLSTGVMVRLGKTYRNLMVDVQQLNAKLQVRARRIVAQACGISEEAAAAALARSNGDVKVAIVSPLLDCQPTLARERLQRSSGNVRLAIVKG